MLGNSWLRPRKAVIDNGESVLCFLTIVNGLKVKVDFLKAVRPVVRKVTTRRAVSLKPGALVHILVNFVHLPKGRSFMFSISYLAIANAIVNAKTP